MEKRISGHTGLMGLFGSPVGHSGSPAMYNFSFQHDGLDYAYLAFDVTEEEMPKAFEAIRLFNMRAGNFTMPCKNIAAKLVDKLSPAAEIIGACNAFVNDNGVITGYITDGVGFVKNLEINGVSVKDMDMAAGASGYSVAGENAAYRLYHMDTYDNWGTISKYEVIGIGSGTPLISQSFPAVEETDSDNLNDYSYEQLSQYKQVILDGFTYDDKTAAEELVLRLSEAGVKVVIYSDGIPQEKKTQSQEFLGVTCSDIVFKNGYPDMDTKLGVLYPDLFPKGYATWQTVYVTGLDNTWGSVMDNGIKLDFYGTVKNDNIIVCGLNLAYYYGVSADKSVGRLLSDMMDITSAQLPERTNIELIVEHDVNGITITSDYDNVNTSLSYHDIFVSDEWLGKKNNLTYVRAGVTKITFKVPYLWQGGCE